MRFPPNQPSPATTTTIPYHNTLSIIHPSPTITHHLSPFYEAKPISIINQPIEKHQMSKLRLSLISFILSPSFLPSHSVASNKLFHGYTFRHTPALISQKRCSRSHGTYCSTERSEPVYIKCDNMHITNVHQTVQRDRSSQNDYRFRYGC